MLRKLSKSKSLVAMTIIVIILFSSFMPIIQAVDRLKINGFDKGPSYTSVVPVKKVTFVNFDEDSILDDYAYLAAVPTSVFSSDGHLFSHPLLFYEDEYKSDKENERSFNARQGIDHFMLDWMDYTNVLDQMTLINVDKNKVSNWRTKEYISISADNPYSIASQLALSDWSYSNDAVVAVIGEDEIESEYIDPIVETGVLKSGKDIIEYTFFTKQLNALAPRTHDFNIPEGYKFIKTRTWWASMWFGTPEKSGFPLHINMTIPAADPDSQLYCKYDNEWMQVGVSQGWNIGGMDKEKIESYVYQPGSWRISLTDVPTFKILGKYGSLLNILKNMLMGTTYQTDISIFPGDEMVPKTPITPPFGCRDATFKLTWSDPSVNLGFIIIGVNGEEIISHYEVGAKNSIEIKLDQLGECLPGESYKIEVFTFDQLRNDVKYQVEYNWRQNFSKTHADYLASATNGAVLASSLNAPLLYIKENNVPEVTKNALLTLGVKNIYLINLGKHITRETQEKISNIAKIKENFIDAIELYQKIMDITGQNDVIFSTIDPWTKWLVGEMKPHTETKAALFIGPAAYIAAHHGSPVLIVDYHPEFSSAVVWHNEFWKRNGDGRQHPNVAQMYLTGKKVYELLYKIGLDKDGEETIITVADQYDIGATWDRVFVGKALPGRFWGSPVDTAHSICRNMFYPALIFNNPGMNPSGVDLIQGSESKRRKLFPWGKFGLVITKPSQIETFKYPVLQTSICYEHKTNERFETYYGFRYKSATNIVPGVTDSNNPIDEGITPGVVGAIWPDMSPTEVIPAYLNKGGYDSVFSNSFQAITDNLNEGVLLWFSSTHGNSPKGGQLLTWDPDKSLYGMLLKGKLMGYQKEENPWRGYEWYLGSTENPDTMTMEIHGFIPALLGNPNMQGLFPTGLDFWPSERPVLHGVFGLLNKIPILKWFIPEWLASSDYYKDGLIIAHTFTTLSTATGLLNGYTMDDAIDRLYSCGWINTACLPAYKYLHLTMIRHGSVFQVIDPWPTSWYAAVWYQSMPRDIILGETVGKAYANGISHVGTLYLDGAIGGGPQWWWDIDQNVCYFGDPDLRAYVPKTDYSSANSWDKPKPLVYNEKLNLQGHMPYGATSYPHAKEEAVMPIWLIIIIVVIVLLIIISLVLIRKKSKK
jgi:hypothetical protein